MREIKRENDAARPNAVDDENDSAEKDGTKRLRRTRVRVSTNQLPFIIYKEGGFVNDGAARTKRFRANNDRVVSATRRKRPAAERQNR